jgi:hypothetical protein
LKLGNGADSAAMAHCEQAPLGKMHDMEMDNKVAVWHLHLLPDDDRIYDNGVPIF